eukprot:362018-Chlamydomonas_euryale.AAC.12
MDVGRNPPAGCGIEATAAQQPTRWRVAGSDCPTPRLGGVGRAQGLARCWRRFAAVAAPSVPPLSTESRRRRSCCAGIAPFRIERGSQGRQGMGSERVLPPPPQPGA